MKLIFIRHGDPNYEDDTLTERGWIEANALAPRVKGWDVDRFYCSPLGRARDTAKAALKGTGREAIVEDYLCEFHVQVIDPVTGWKRIPWDLMPAYWTKIPSMYDKDNWHDADIYRTGEITEQKAKVVSGIDKLLSEYGYTRSGRYYKTEAGSDKTVVFFCHLGVQFVILSHLLGVSAPVLWHNFFVAPTSVTTVATEEREKGNVSFRCKGLGDVSHLYAAGIAPSDSGFFNEVFKD